MSKEQNSKANLQDDPEPIPERTPLLPESENEDIPLEEQLTRIIRPKSELQVTLNPDTRYEYLNKDSLDATDNKDLSELGRGGFGRVLISYDQNIGREVAIKELLPLSEKEYLKRFLFEARITGQLDHPNIVPVYEIGTRKDGSHYYTMKLVHGKTLADAVADAGALEDRLKLLRHFEDTCHAIAYAHSKGVIHRDIKPMNIMIGEYGETVVLDWGIAKVLGEGEEEGSPQNSISSGLSVEGNYVTLNGKVIGTPKYMSPEQKIGYSEQIDERSDVWSLGAVLYEILTGKPPFHDLTPLKIVNETKFKPVPPVNSLCPEVPSELAAIADKALALKKADRYENAKALADEIEAWRSGLRVTAYEYSPWELVKKFVTHNKALSYLIGLAIVVVLTATGIVSVMYRSAETARRQEQASRVQSQANEREANYNLSVAYHEKAIREASEKDFLSASVFSAAALKHNPGNPRGSFFKSAGNWQPDPLVENQLLLQQSCFYKAFFNRSLTFYKKLEDHTDTIYELAFHPESQMIASGSRDSTIRLWSLTAKKDVTVLDGHQNSVLALAFAPDGKFLASAGRDGCIKIWDMASRKLFKEILISDTIIYDLAYSPDGKYLVSAGSDNKIKLWRIPGYSENTMFRSKTEKGVTVAFSPDSSLLACSTEDGKIELISIPSVNKLGILHGNKDFVERIAFSPDGKLLASAGRDQTVRLWDVKSRKQIASSAEHGDWVWSISFSKDGNFLVSASRDYTIKLWHVPTLTCLNTIKRSKIGQSPQEVLFSPDGNLLASCFDKAIFLFKFDPTFLKNIFWGNKKIIVFAKMSQDGKTLALASYDKILLWDIHHPHKPIELKEENNLIRSIDFSPDGRYLISAGHDGIVYVHDLLSKLLLTTLSGHQGRVFSVAFGSDGDLIASAGDDKTVRLWSLKQGKMIHSFIEHQSRINSVAFSPDGKILASGSKDQTIILRDIGQKKFIAELKDHPAEVQRLVFSSDGKQLFSLFRDGTMQLWDVEKKTLQATLKGHSAWVNSAGFSPDGKMLVSGGDDRKLLVWDLKTKKMLLDLQFPNQITYAAFTPDGTHIIFNDDHEIKMYPIRFDLFDKNPETLLAEAEKAAGFSLSQYASGSVTP